MPEEGVPEEERERPRPRVVDKRVSARRSEPQTEPQAPPGDAASDVSAGPPRGAAGPSEADQAPPGAPGAEEPLWTPEQEAEARRLAEEIAQTPGRDWVVNAAVTLVNVAATKLDRGMLEEARLAIDGIAGILDSVGEQLGEAEGPLRQTLAQLQMAYAQTIQGGPGRPQSPPSPGR